ncbi:MAG: DUF4234 domain-containing protein [Eubacterium sp.]|nr:DUF4234 domain-containing protein [Eubacterium sp.]
MEKLKEDRNYYLVFLIGFVPFGFIYGMFFQYDAIKSLNIACGRKEGNDTSQKSVSYLIFFLLNMVTAGIYELYWINQQGKRMSNVGDAYGIRREYIDPDRTAINSIIISYLMIILGALLVIIPILGWIIYLVLLIVALVMRLQAYNKFYSDLNVLCRAYNRELDGIPSRPEAGSARALHSPVEKPVLPPPAPKIAPPPAPEIMQAPYVNPPQPAAAPWHEGGVLMATGQYAGSRIQMRPGETITIGRDPARCALVCESDKISRAHVAIQYQDGFYMVTDLSTNGTISSESGRLPKNQAVRQRSGTSLQLAQSNESVRLL